MYEKLKSPTSHFEIALRVVTSSQALLAVLRNNNTIERVEWVSHTHPFHSAISDDVAEHLRVHERAVRQAQVCSYRFTQLHPPGWLRRS